MNSGGYIPSPTERLAAAFGGGSILFLIVFWIVGTFVNVAIAKEKGRDAAASFFVSLFLSPVVGYLYLLAVPALPKSPKADKLPEPVRPANE
jgi:hypothetical protein